MSSIKDTGNRFDEIVWDYYKNHEIRMTPNGLFVTNLCKEGTTSNSRRFRNVTLAKRYIDKQN